MDIDRSEDKRSPLSLHGHEIQRAYPVSPVSLLSDAPDDDDDDDVVGSTSNAKGNFTFRFLGGVLLAMCVVTGILLSVLLRSKSSTIVLRINSNAIDASHILPPLADMLHLSQGDIAVKSSAPWGNGGQEFTIDLANSGKDQLMRLMSDGDPRLSKTGLIEVDSAKVCPIGKKGPTCSECATKFGFSGAQCDKYLSTDSQVDPFAFISPMRDCDTTETMKCVKSEAVSGIRVVNLAGNVACVRRIDNGAVQQTSMNLASPHPMAFFEDRNIGKSLPFVALYGSFDHITYVCDGEFIGFLWCHSEKPCQKCPINAYCENNGVCETALPGDGSCKQCPKNHFGLNCQSCSSSCKLGCLDGYSGTGDCLCDNNRMGPNCDRCQPGHYGPGCVPCLCTSKGVCADGTTGTGECHCTKNFAGTICDRCADGFDGINCDICREGRIGPNCLPCPCGPLGRCDGNLTQMNVKCVCNDNVIGSECNQCAAGWFGPQCHSRCACDLGQTCSDGINGTGQCSATPAPGPTTRPSTTALVAPSISATLLAMRLSPCRPGFAPPLCLDCQSGFYGASCTECVCGSGHQCSDGLSGDGSCRPSTSQ